MKIYMFSQLIADSNDEEDEEDLIIINKGDK